MDIKFFRFPKLFYAIVDYYYSDFFVTMKYLSDSPTEPFTVTRNERSEIIFDPRNFSTL